MTNSQKYNIGKFYHIRWEKGLPVPEMFEEYVEYYLANRNL